MVDIALITDSMKTGRLINKVNKIELNFKADFTFGLFHSTGSGGVARLKYNDLVSGGNTGSTNKLSFLSHCALSLL